MAKHEISLPVIRRLPRYHRFLHDLMQEGASYISSKTLSERMGLTASQIRQDLNCFGGFGQQGYGYPVEQLYREIGHILGVDETVNAILIGVGNIGRAVANQMQFDKLGMHLAAAFDVSPQLIGQTVRGVEILSQDRLEEFCMQHKPAAALLCVPDKAAQSLAQRLTALGVYGFWNFTHYDIARDFPDIAVENVHLEDSLMTLSYRMKNR